MPESEVGWPGLAWAFPELQNILSVPRKWSWITSFCPPTLQPCRCSLRVLTPTLCLRWGSQLPRDMVT